MQTNRLYILFTVLAMSLSNLIAYAQDTKTEISNNLVTNDTITKNDSIPPVKKKEAIDYVIEHTAEDYILEDVVHKKVKLYNNAHVTYDVYDITSGEILIDYNTNIVKAKGIPDENGKYSQLPVFKTTGNETTQDSLLFNYKTKKAIIYGLETEQDGINTLGQKTKRVNDSTIFVRNIIFTTSNPRNPDYYLKTNKAKIVPGKKIITGTTNLVLADVPTPLFFPFAYFPLTKSKASGIIFPTYGESLNQGFFLQNGGYYFAGNDYFDLSLTGDIYSNSSWGTEISTNYKVRYRFGGRFNFKYDNLITGFQGSSNFSVRKNFNIQWNHSQDAKASPNSTFRTSVNLGSSQFFRQSVNEVNRPSTLTNELRSSISYSKNFVGTPFRMTLSADHRQNTNTERVTATLPSLQINMDRQFPFAPKNGAKKNALQNIGVSYTLNAENRVDTTEDLFFSDQLFSDARTGARHNVSLSTNTKVLKHFTLSPNVSYQEVWDLESLDTRFDENAGEVVRDTISGFSAYRTFNTGASLSTTIYGLFKFKNSNLKAIRHTIRPTITYTYTPDFSFYFDEIQTDTNGNTAFFSEFDNFVFGRPSRGTSNILSFSLANSLEAKVKDKKSLEGEDKKINILNSLNFSSSYDFTAESFKLRPINMSGSTTIFKKININFGATFDPYLLAQRSNGTNVVIDALSYKNGGPLVRITAANFNTGYSFSSKDFGKNKDPKKEDDETEQETPHDQNLFGDSLNNTRQRAIEDTTPSKDEDITTLPQYISNMPWNLRFSYTSAYSNRLGENRITSNSLTASGDIQLSPGWQVGVSSGYDFVNKGVTFTSFRFSRDLRSWNMSFNWSPIGNNSSYNFFIGVKSSVLSDLKWDKNEVIRDF